MSVQATFLGGPQALKPVRITNTSKTDILDGRKDMFAVVAIGATCEGSGDTVTIFFNDGYTDWRIWTKAVAANSTEIMDQHVIRLRNGTKLKAQLASGNATTIAATVVAAHQNAPVTTLDSIPFR